MPSLRTISTEYNTFRGNIYSHPVLGENGAYQVDSMGFVKIEWGKPEDKRDVLDGDFASMIDTDYPLDTTGFAEVKGTDPKLDPTDVLAPRVSKRSRVYKGGSWADRIYWLNPSNRRYLDQDKASSKIGFRCAMSTLGDQIPSTPLVK